MSNNRINDLIAHHQIDFGHDEDLLAHYISFLKTLALKLDENTVQFFFNEREQRFPLLAEAAKYHDHHETMVQTAVRNLTLQVLRVGDASTQRYLARRFVVPFTAALSHTLARNTERLVSALLDAGRARPPMRASTASGGAGRRRAHSPGVLADTLDDELMYMNDALGAMRVLLSALWARTVFRHWIAPQLLECTLHDDELDAMARHAAASSSGAASASAATALAPDDAAVVGDVANNNDDDDDDTSSSDVSSSSSSSSSNSSSDAASSSDGGARGAAARAAHEQRRVVLWTTLARAMLRFTYAPLANALAWRLDRHTDNRALVARCASACAAERASGITLSDQLRQVDRRTAARQRAMSQTDNVTEEARMAEANAKTAAAELENDDGVPPIDGDIGADSASAEDATRSDAVQAQLHAPRASADTRLAVLCALGAVADNESIDAAVRRRVLDDARLHAVAELLGNDAARSADVSASSGSKWCA